MKNKFLTKVAALGFVVSLLCSGCGSGVTLIALVSPTISQVSPQVVTAGTPNVTVTVQGANFESQAALTVNGTAVPTTVVNSTTIAAKISGSALAQPAVAQLQVRNSNGVKSNQVPLTVTNPVQGGNSLSITTTDLPSAQVGTAYNVTLTAAGGTAPYTWAVSSGTLPAGLTLSSGGVLSGTPTSSGTSSFAITASDSSSPQSTKTITVSIAVAPVTIVPPALTINSATLASPQAGATYSVTLGATGGTPGYTWSIASGSLPAGLSLSSNGVISGTPTATGTSNFTVAVKDSGSPAQTASVSESVTVAPPGLNITTPTLGAGQIGASFSGSVSATGGTPGYTWSIASGTLPAGLTMSSGGVISGTPTSTGTSTFTVAVKDSGSPAQTASVQESILVVPPGLNVTTISLGAAQIGSSYSAPLNALGGTPNYTWSIASGSLPAGLSLSSGGVISGTPAATGTSTFTVAVKDSGSPVQTASSQESITVSPAALAITTTSLAAGTNGSSYSATVSATGGTPGYTWSIASGSLPAGLTMSSGGVISGTPAATGTSTFTVAVKDSGSQTATAQESIAVSPAQLAITTASLAAGTNGSSYNAPLSATGGTPSYTWSIASGNLPAGLSMSSGGVISGMPTATGTSTFMVAVKDSASQTATAQMSIAVSPAGLTITTTSLTAGTNGGPYSATVNATGGTPGYTWTIASGSLPAGLSMSSGGVISGTPTATGTSTFTVAVKDSASQTVTAQVSIAVSPAGLAVTTASLAAGTNGTSYSATVTATGGTPSYTWSVSSGSLPAGLTMSTGGVISGMPTGSGTSTFTVAVKDSGSQTASAQESITVAAAPTPLTVTSTSLGGAQTGSVYSTALNATGGAPSYTWSISSGSLPAGLSLSSGGLITGTPTATGSSTFTVTVTDNSSPTQTASAQESIAVALPPLAVSTTTLSYGTTGASYSATVNATGGTPAYTWTVASGSLPAGLSMSSAGVITGTPTAAGASSFTVSVSDSESPTQTATALESITISAPITPGSAQIYVFPQTPIAPRGSYQSVTAIVTGVNDKTVTWTTDGGTIVGTNPCVVNEPCTVALYATNPGTYHLTATSNASHSVVATSTITITASPVQRTDHPRFLMTSDMLTGFRAKATPDNTMYQAIKAMATNYYNYYGTIWTYSTWNGSACTGGSGPSSDQSANYTEVGAWWMTLVSLLDPSAATRNQYGCAARDVFMTDAQDVISGKINVAGNRAGNSGEYWAFLTDYLMGGGYLSASDQATARQYLYQLEKDEISGLYGEVATIGSYNSPVQFGGSDELAATNMRSMGNNYTQARILLMSAAALTFNDNATDDPALANTCSATRYQVCPDGTAGSLHAYWTYVTGGLLYKDWADLEDPSVFQAAFNLTSTPMCNTFWGQSISCLGSSRGGESSEGTSYGNSLGSLRRAMNALHTAGYDDPMLYGPQISIGTMSYWDLRYVGDFTLLTGLSGFPTEQSRWNYLTNGDSLNYYAYPSNFMTEAAMLSGDSAIGRTDRSAALQWMVMNTAYGMASGQVGNCQFYCGLNAEMANDYASSVDLDLFLSLPAGDPTTNNPPADPRSALPTDWYNAGNQHLVTRTGGWTTGANTIFSYYCTNTQIDHEHQFCGGFDVYSNGEYITKGRMEFDDYNDELSTAWNKNGLALVQYPGQTWCTSNPWCSFNQATTEGGQFWHGYQAGTVTLQHAELSNYVAAIADFTNAYNGGWGVFAQFKAVTAASRSLVYLRGSNQVVYYDRGATGSNAWDKATYIVSTGSPTINGNTASWLTRSGNQRVFWTALEPAGSAPQLDTTYTDGYAANDWEIYGRIKADAGSVASARFLSVLQWGSSSFSGAAATRVVSSAGTNFEGALVGSSMAMFMQNWPGTLTTVTYPASGATTHYVSDLTPNTTYNISASGAPTSATTDNAGVLTFNAAGTGDVTITAAP